MINGRRLHINAKEFLDMMEDKCLRVICGYENMMNDSGEGSESYECAKSVIEDLDAIIDEAYDELESDLGASIGVRLREVIAPKIKAKLNK